MRTPVDLLGAIVEFAALLRTEYDIPAGHADAHEALRALEAVGVAGRERVRHALRATFCTKQDQIAAFDRAFDAFFGDFARGVRQPRPAPPEIAESLPKAAARGRSDPEDLEAGAASHVLQARYSPQASRAHAVPTIPAAGLAEALADASRLIAALRLGRTRRWKPHLRGKRFDLRRTLRASLQTGGDPVHLRTLGHPLRNPRIVLFLDASRSMSQHSDELLQFAYALCRRSQRASVFAFSTALREITRDLRKTVHGAAKPLEDLGEAWGGGTRIGACLLEFVRTRLSRIDADTLVIVASDGLDVGEIAHLQRAMREISRRCAGIFWLNPHAGRTGFEPSARGMQAALPYVSALLDATDLHALGAAAHHLRR